MRYLDAGFCLETKEHSEGYVTVFKAKRCAKERANIQTLIILTTPTIKIILITYIYIDTK